MVKWDCFAYGSETENGCKALTKCDCDKCKFYKTKRNYENERRNCELRIRRVYGMSSKEFLDSRRTNNND